MGRYVLFFTCFVLVKATGFSQESVDSIWRIDGDQVTITADRFEEVVGRADNAVTVIDSVYLRRSSATHLGELLAETTGIYITGTTQNPGANQSLFMRGNNSNHFIVMIDGIRLTDPSTVNNTIDLSELSLASVERIEIVRGPASVLYGSSGIGGVINIITRKKGPTDVLDISLLGGWEFYGDGNDGQLTGISLAHALGPLHIRAGITEYDVDGFDTTIDTIANPLTFNPVDEDDFVKRDIHGSVQYVHDHWKAHFQYRRTDQTADIDNGAFRDDDLATLDFDRNHFLGSIGYQLSDRWDVQWRGAHTNLGRRSLFPPSVIDATGLTDSIFSESLFKGRQWTQELSATMRMPFLKWVWGAGWWRDHMNTISTFESPSFTFSEDLTSQNISADQWYTFGQVVLAGQRFHPALRQWRATMGLRFTYHDAFEGNWTSNVQLTYAIDDEWTAYTNFSTSFNAPSLFQLFSPTVDFTTGITLGNPMLAAESGRGIEIGLKWTSPKRHRLSLSAFRTTVDDLIEFVYLWDAQVAIADLNFLHFNGQTYLNVGRQAISGIEIDGEWLWSDRASLMGQLTWIDGTQRVSENGASSDHTQGHRVQIFSNGAFVEEGQSETELSRRPITASAAVTYRPLGSIRLGLHWQYVGMRQDVAFDSSLGPFGAQSQLALSDYHLWKITAAWDFGRLQLGLAVDNVFDVAYTEIQGFQTRGRTFRIRVRY